jgi:hypothetical protein
MKFVRNSWFSLRHKVIMLQQIDRQSQRLFGLLLLLCCAPLTSCAQKDQGVATQVRIVREQQLQVPFPKEFSNSPVVEFLQFAELEWGEATGEIAASAHQGSWIYIVNPQTGVTRTIRTGQPGNARKLSWIPNTKLLVSEGSLLHFAGNAQVYDTTTDLSQPLSSEFMNARSALRGITLPDGRPGFVSVGEPKSFNTESGVKHYAYFHAVQESKPISKEKIFPTDTSYYHIEPITRTAVGFAETPAGLISAKQVHVVIKPGGIRQPDGSFSNAISKHEVWVSNLSTGRTLCQIYNFDESPYAGGGTASARGIGLSKSARWMAVNTSKGLDLYDAKTCQRMHRLSQGAHALPQIGGQGRPMFTADEKYLVIIGVDVRTSKGGYLSVWRVADGQLLYNDEIDNPNALAVNPKEKRFVVGHNKGQLSFFRIDD